MRCFHFTSVTRSSTLKVMYIYQVTVQSETESARTPCADIACVQCTHVVHCWYSTRAKFASCAPRCRLPHTLVKTKVLRPRNSYATAVPHTGLGTENAMLRDELLTHHSSHADHGEAAVVNLLVLHRDQAGRVLGFEACGTRR